LVITSIRLSAIHFGMPIEAKVNESVAADDDDDDESADAETRPRN
jgi:hypothetical protein